MTASHAPGSDADAAHTLLTDRHLHLYSSRRRYLHRCNLRLQSRNLRRQICWHRNVVASHQRHSSHLPLQPLPLGKNANVRLRRVTRNHDRVQIVAPHLRALPTYLKALDQHNSKQATRQWLPEVKPDAGEVDQSPIGIEQLCQLGQRGVLSWPLLRLICRSHAML